MYNMEKVMYIGNGFGSLTWGVKYSLISEHNDDYSVFDDWGNVVNIPKKDFADRGSELAKIRAKNYMMLKDGYKLKKESESEYGYTPKETDSHYDNSNGSLYLFAEQHNLNSYEFDCIKRLVRCRKKGQFKEDLEKTIRVIELYLKEHKL
jgi:hypothetical protein